MCVYICVNIFYTPKVNNYITQLDILKTYLAMIENQNRGNQIAEAQLRIQLTQAQEIEKTKLF